MKEIQIIIIEDNKLLRDGLCEILQKEKDIKVLAAYDDGEFAEDKINDLKPDVLLLDLGLTNTNSLELANSLKDKIHKVKIIVMDLIPVHDDILQFVEAGVKGFIMKDATLDEFIKTIHSVAAGETVLPPVMAGTLFSQILEYGIKELGIPVVSQSLRLTKRECEIVGLIGEGLSNKEISKQLNISIFTVKSHVHNILEKMTLSNRVQIAIYSQNNETCPD